MAATSSAYSGVAAAWDAGPARLYHLLAQVIVAEYPDPAGMSVLDIGAGTGAVSRALRARDARPTGVDLAADMVARTHDAGLEAVAGDMLALPFADHCFDGAVAAFSISHTDPVAALRETSRVVRVRGPVLAGVFAARDADPTKEAIDGAAARFGYERPGWYVRLKTELEPLCNTPALLLRCAADAGLRDGRVMERVVDTGLSSPADIVAVRAGMAHLAPFVASLSPQRRRAFVVAAIAALGDRPQPLRPAVLILSSHAPA